jgi:trans-aconitate 2-methyltransferase
MATNDWNPELYLRFGGERTRPAVDLIARIKVQAPRTIIDIGCGPGNSTQALAARFPGARLTGLDSSPAMLAKARADHPQHEWLLADAGGFESERRFDIVFSNAAIQWMPDHPRLLARMAALASPGGALAVQTPMFHDMPIRQAITRTAERPRWRRAMNGCDALFTFHPHGFYYDQLSGRAATIDLWETSYVHVMASLRALVEWMSATGLRPYLDRLPEAADQQAFAADLLEELGQDYQARADGKVLFPFRRLFFIAYF